MPCPRLNVRRSPPPYPRTRLSLPPQRHRLLFLLSRLSLSLRGNQLDLPRYCRGPVSVRECGVTRCSRSPLVQLVVLHQALFGEQAVVRLEMEADDAALALPVLHDVEVHAPIARV